MLRKAGTSHRGVVALADLLGASDRALLARFAHFYIPRRDPRYLRRNALVALGNGRDRRVGGILAGYLGYPDPLLRMHAAWALGRLGTGRRTLLAAREREQDTAVLEEIRLALAATVDTDRVP